MLYLIFVSMEIGTKIRKVRELKGFSQENVAEELGMSVTGYGKIERNEVSVNVERLTKIAEILQVGVEQIIGFDDNVAFNNFNSTVEWQVGHYSMPIEMKKLYDDKIALLEDKIKYLTKEVSRYRKIAIKSSSDSGMSDDELIDNFGELSEDGTVESVLLAGKEILRKRK